jgi:ribosome-associated protein
MLVINERISIPLREFRWTYARSSGPGGQNVNKVSSKVMLTWVPADSPQLPPAVRQRLLAQQQARINLRGELQITSDRYRDQPRNRADCLDRLQQMLVRAATPPKRRRPTKPTRASKERRLRGKREQAAKKAGRKPPAGRSD